MNLPPPPPLAAQVFASVVSYLAAHRFSFPFPPTLAVVADIPDPGQEPIAAAYPGGLVLIRSDFLALGITASFVHVLLHEALHETVTGGVSSTVTPVGHVGNEQATESMTLDILPALLRKFGMPLRLAGTAYPGLVRRERAWSARSCSCPWTSPIARGIRADLFLTSPELRTTDPLVP